MKNVKNRGKKSVVYSVRWGRNKQSLFEKHFGTDKVDAENWAARQIESYITQPLYREKGIPMYIYVNNVCVYDSSAE